jgi:hypothetical protein
MTTTSVSLPVFSPAKQDRSAGTTDLTDRQVGIFVTIAAAVLIAALVVLALYAGPGSVPASTSFRDLTEAAFATLI